jgi:hypothetical protein
MKVFSLAIVVVLAAVVAAGSAVGAKPVQQSPIAVTAESTPVFLGSTPQCAAGRAEFQLTSAGGAVVGSGHFCFQTFDFSCDPTCHDSADLTAVFALAGGKIEAAGSLGEVFDDSLAVQTGTAIVTEATGVYLGLAGTVDWTGPIVFDTNGVPHPDLTFTIALS